ncbi:MAG: hypothetical protein R6V10_12310 [bacterium]
MIAALLFLALFELFPTVAGETSSKRESSKPARPEKAPDYYKEGIKAFRRGDDERAAALLVKAARRDWRARAVLSDPRWKAGLPEEPLSGLSGLKKQGRGSVSASAVLYRLGTIRKTKARERWEDASVAGEARIKRAGCYFFEKVVKEHGGSAEDDDAALRLVEASLCVKSSAYPACTAWSIRRHEGWLEEYSYSKLRSRVMKKLADLYLDLADRLEEPAPWRSRKKAELCRGKAISLASVLARDRSDRNLARWAERFIKEIKSSGKAYSTVPSSLLR